MMDIYGKFTSVVGMLRRSIATKAGRGDLAPAFSPSAEYAAGRLAIYSDTLYRCVAPHKGAWDASHFERASVEDALRDKADRSELRYGYARYAVDIGSDASVALADRKVTIVTLASGSEVQGQHSLSVELPSDVTSVRDVLLRVDALDASLKGKPLPSLSFDTSRNALLSGAPGWDAVSGGVNVFTFTSVGTLSGRSAWLVGKVVSDANA